MCRLMAYMGPPVLVADVVLWPDRSIIKQSYDARERKMDANLPSHLAYGNLNGDGFGIGWYTESANQSSSSRRGDQPTDTTPCVFTSITPAWWAMYFAGLWKLMRICRRQKTNGSL